MATRREILAAGAAAVVTLPMLQSAVRRANAAAPASGPATTATAPARGAAGRGRGAPDEKAGWFATKIKPADVKENEFTDVEGHVIALARVGKDITALTTKCTHQGVQIKPTPGAKTLTCSAHKSVFNLDGTNAGGPAKTPLVQYAIRVNADGFIEIDPGTKPKADDKDAKITVSA